MTLQAGIISIIYPGDKSRGCSGCFGIGYILSPRVVYSRGVLYNVPDDLRT